MISELEFAQQLHRCGSEEILFLFEIVIVVFINNRKVLLEFCLSEQKIENMASNLRGTLKFSKASASFASSF